MNKTPAAALKDDHVRDKTRLEVQELSVKDKISQNISELDSRNLKTSEDKNKNLEAKERNHCVVDENNTQADICTKSESHKDIRDMNSPSNSRKKVVKINKKRKYNGDVKGKYSSMVKNTKGDSTFVKDSNRDNSFIKSEKKHSKGSNVKNLKIMIKEAKYTIVDLPKIDKIDVSKKQKGMESLYLADPEYSDIYSFSDFESESEPESLELMRFTGKARYSQEFEDLSSSNIEIDYYELQRNLIITKAISIDYKEFLKNKAVSPKKSNVFTSITMRETSGFFITSKAPLGQIKTLVDKQFKLISIYGTSPHSVEPCLKAEACAAEVFPHCRLCCDMHNSAGTISHSYKVTVYGAVSDLEWMVFISQLHADHGDDLDMISGRWPPEDLGTTSSCKPCQVRLNSVSNLSKFRLFS